MVSSPPVRALQHMPLFQWINNISCCSTVCHFSKCPAQVPVLEKRDEETEKQSFALPLGPGAVRISQCRQLYLQSTCFLQMSSPKFLKTAAQFIFIVDLNEVGRSQSGLSLTCEGSFKNCLNHKEQLANQQGRLWFFKMFLKGIFIIQLVNLWNQKKCSFLLFLYKRPPSGWCVPDKVYLGHRQLRTYQQMPDAQVSAEGGQSGGQLLDPRETW